LRLLRGQGRLRPLGGAAPSPPKRIEVQHEWIGISTQLGRR
jgi:hypothetical protein